MLQTQDSPERADTVTPFQATARRCADAEWTTQTEDAYTMGMALTVPRYTFADLDLLPDDGNRYEVRGRRSPSAGWPSRFSAARRVCTTATSSATRIWRLVSAKCGWWTCENAASRCACDRAQGTSPVTP